jgi:hypothetical protein
VSKRTEIFKRFQETPYPKVLLIQPQSAAHGVTLTAADTIIWYSPVTSIETYLQANARIDRQGQKNKMTIVHIKGSPVEARLYNLLQNKLDVHTDGSFLTFSIMLSSSKDYEGGGTQFNDGIKVFLEQGDILVHSGYVKHSGLEVTKGKRYILVGFTSININDNE